MMAGAPRLEDRLGPLEPPYKSRGEAQVGRLLDRYGLGYICDNPEILFASPSRLMRYRRPVHRNYHGCAETPDVSAGNHDNTLDRMAEAYQILDQLYDTWPAPNTERRMSRMARYECLSHQLY